MGLRATLKDLEIKGIRGITRERVVGAHRKGYAVKLVASIRDNQLRVEPKEIPNKDPICVWGVLNAVAFKCTRLGRQTVVGRGAGGIETALSIVRDLIDVKQSLVKNLEG
jgi:homoserine dehydrogenase